jgi:LysR family glycine cleavage system transcriptional activator
MGKIELPALNSLRAFEAAARYESFKAAAEELRVTPSAVGYQVRGLEAFIGVRLFHRVGHRLKLTTAGSQFSRQLREGFDVLSRATKAIRRDKGISTLTVSATPALALRWLAPKVDEFRQRHPQIEFRIDASPKDADLDSGEVDLDIRYGLSADPKLNCDVIFREDIFPVCHPSLVSRRTPQLDLTGYVLLQVDDWAARGGVWRCWEDWFTLCGVAALHPVRGPKLSQIDLAVEAASQQKGFAMGTERHLSEPRYKGLLIRPFRKSLKLTYMAYMVCLPEVAHNPPVRAFRQWILRSAEKDKPEIMHHGAF